MLREGAVTLASSFFYEAKSNWMRELLEAYPKYKLQYDFSEDTYYNSIFLDSIILLILMYLQLIIK